MRRVTIFTNSLGHGGSEKQAAFIGAGLLARGWDVRVVSVLARDDYSTPQLAERTTFLGKRAREDFFRVVKNARATIDPTAPVMCFNWYPTVIARLAVPQAVRIARWGGTPSADGVRNVKRVLASAAQRSSAAVIGCSWGVVRQAVRELGSPRYMCASIPNGVYFREQPAQQPVWPRRYLLSAGRLSPEKDHATLLKAFAILEQHVPHDLVIAGDGREESRLKALTDSLGLGARVHFVGYRHDLPALLAHADLLVHTSRWEGFGNVLVEAMNAGTPVVAADAPFGPRSILERVPGGVLVDVGDAQMVADAVLTLLHDDAERERLSSIGREGVERYFGTENLLSVNELLIEQVVRATGRSSMP